MTTPMMADTSISPCLGQHALVQIVQQAVDAVAGDRDVDDVLAQELFLLRFHPALGPHKIAHRHKHQQDHHGGDRI